MPTVPVRQSRFLGEIAPDLYGRTDHPLYPAALRRMWNFFATPQGSAKNRAGTKLVASSKDPAQKARLIPFVFSSTQTYVLEFGNLYVRFHQNGGQVISGGVPYEVVTPFTTAMLPYLKYAQVGDTMTLCYGGQEPGGTAAVAVQELKRIAHTNWTIGAVSFAPPANGTQGVGPYVPVSGNALPDATHIGRQWWWWVTQLLRDANGNVFETAGFSYGLGVLPTYNPLVSYGQGSIVTDLVRVFTSLVGANLGNTPATSPTQWAPGVVVYSDKGIEVTHNQTAPGGYTRVALNYYRVQDGTPGWVAQTDPGQTSFVDDSRTADFSIQPPKSTNPFATPAGDYPSCVAIFEQRRIFGRQAAHPQRLQGSRSGKYSNFDVDLFVKDDDAIQFDIASQQLDEIRALVPLRTLLAFTPTSEYAIEGFQGSPLSPSSVDVRRQMGSRGSSWLDPLVIGNTVLHVQDSGNSVRDLVHDWRTDTYNGTYVSLTAAHLFEGRTIVDATYQQIPNSIAWFVRDDGALLGVTYSTESQDPAMVVVAWHKHITDGFVENVCSVREGAEDALYLLVRRTINGVTKRYVERMQTRVVSDVRLACFLDCALSVDGRNTGGTTMAFLSDSTYAGGEEGTITASAAAFVVGAGSTDIGDAMVLDPDGSAYSLTILSVTDATHARARLDKALPAAWQNVASTSWGWARDSFLGLDHLEGKSVNLLGDGDKQGPFVVAGGQIGGISPPVVIAQIGLAYQPLLELLDVPGDVAKGKQKIVKSVAAEVTSSRGMKAGEDETNLFEWDDERNVDIGAGTVPLFTGRMKVRIQDAASPDGRAVVVQDDPLPLTIVALTREIAVGGDL